MFNLALFMDIIKGHTCVLRAVDTDSLHEQGHPKGITTNALHLLIALFICTCHHFERKADLVL